MNHERNAEELVRLDSVGLSYGHGGDVLRDLDLVIPRGSFHFLLGPSGSGKSSLLRMLSLMQRPTRGRLHLFSHDVSRLARDERPRLRRRIGVVYQDFRLLDHLTVEENVALPLKIAGENRREIAPKVEEMLNWVGLAPFARVKPPILSGGQKQRAAIARAVIGRPDLVLADEPSGSLDLSLSQRFMHLFNELHRDGVSVIYATHDEQLLKMFDHPVLRLRDGKVLREA